MMIAGSFSRHRESKRRRLAVTGPIAVMTLLSLAGCTSDDDPPVTVSSSPALSAPAGSGGPTPTQQPTSPRDQVIAAYRGYWDASQKAAAQPPDQARKTLATYSSPGLIDVQLKGMRNLQAKNREPWGAVKLQIYAVDVQGATQGFKGGFADVGQG